MPPQGPIGPQDLLDVVEHVGVYPIEAFEFVQAGLQCTVQSIHANKPEDANRHVTGQDLCEGLRQFALRRWGMLAGAVLNRWNITTTFDFGRIVFALVEHGLMSKTDDDTVEDFRDVYNFTSAFESGYKIECKV